MDIPDPGQYEDWREWANQLILILLEEEEKKKSEDKDEATRRGAFG